MYILCNFRDFKSNNEKWNVPLQVVPGSRCLSLEHVLTVIVWLSMNLPVVQMENSIYANKKNITDELTTVGNRGFRAEAEEKIT